MKYGTTKYSHKLIEETKQVWQPESDGILSDKDAIEIIDNTIALFELIIELERKYGQEKTNI